MTQRQLGFFDDQVDVQAGVRSVSDWPEPERFPLNFGRAKAGTVVLNDLASSTSPLIVTGFTSLDYVIDFLADLPADRPEAIRFLIGSEPTLSRRSRYSISKKTLPQEVIDYWLDANARFHQQKEPKRYREARQLVENYWSRGDDKGGRIGTWSRKRRMSSAMCSGPIRQCRRLSMSKRWLGRPAASGLPGF